jgi:hypothetical protein
VTESLRVLLANIIDYAGAFPPANLDLATAIKNYETYRQGEWSWMLGRFVVPAAHVEQVKHLPVTVVVSDVQRVRPWPVDSVEIRVGSLAELQSARKLIPASLPTYFEIPASGELIPKVERAKIRTSDISAADLARFIARCAEARVPFKATAGLHHALRTEQHGFLNVALAAAFALAAAKPATLVELLHEKSAAAFLFDDKGVAWRGQRLTNDQLRQARQRGFVAFGSCSFDEPVESLRQL